MTLLGKLLYSKALQNSQYIKDGKIPYEKLSEFIAWKLQKQIYYHDYTFGQLIGTITHRVKSKYKGWIFKSGYYFKDGKKYNKYTDKPFYIHDQKGTYAHLSQPCKPDCKYCHKTINTYSQYIPKKEGV